MVTLERFSPTTKLILQPYNFLRLHEVIQMTVIILSTVLIPLMIFRELTNNFDLLKRGYNLWLAILFIVGIYFYATGNGVHEVSSYIFNTFCDTKKIAGGVCASAFFNDYYFGNILYFSGAYLLVISLILLEKQNLPSKLDRMNRIILIINAIIFAFAIFAYAAFDRVLVGLIYSVITTITVIILYFSLGKKRDSYPYIVYTLITYSLGTTASLIVRFII